MNRKNSRKYDEATKIELLKQETVSNLREWQNRYLSEAERMYDLFVLTNDETFFHIADGLYAEAASWTREANRVQNKTVVEFQGWYAHKIIAATIRQNERAQKAVECAAARAAWEAKQRNPIRRLIAAIA